MHDFIRQASFELYNADSKNIVKTAGVIKRFVNWVKGFGDPEFQKRVQSLQEESPEVKGLIDNLSLNLGELNKAISNMDPDSYGQILENIKPQVQELSVKLQQLDDKASDVLSNAPVDGFLDEHGRYVGLENQNLEKGWNKDKNQRNKWRAFLPQDLDVPIDRHINKPIKDFAWFQKFQPQNIRISENAGAWVIDAVARVLFDDPNTDTKMLGNIFKENKYVILNQLRENILNGILRSYTFPSSGQPNKMLMVVDAGEVNIPGLGFNIHFPTVLLSDKSTMLMPIDELELNSVKNVRAVKDPSFYQNPKVEPEVVQSTRFDEFLKTAKEPETLQYQQFAYQDLGDIHGWARNVIINAFKRVMGREPTEGEIQSTQAVAHLESYYGRGWKGEGKGSNNWGAIQCTGTCDESNSFSYKDSNPQSDGTQKWYVTRFRKYNTPEDGAADLIKTLFLNKTKNYKEGDNTRTRGDLLLEAANNGDTQAFSTALYETSYYGGTGKDKETRIQRHMQAMNKALQNMSKHTGVEIVMNDQSVQQPQNQAFDAQDAQELMGYLYAAGPIERIVKRGLYDKLLPKTNLLITIDADKVYNSVRFAKVLSCALRNEYDAESSIHHYGDKIEIESNISGSEFNVKTAVQGLCDALADVFDKRIKTNIVLGAKSNYSLICAEELEINFRKFALKGNNV